jgi:tRNA modification GTPase
MLVLAHVEAHIDFPDEDIAPDTHDQLLGKLRAGSVFVEQLLRTAREGKILRNGVRCAIIGRPNAGKSSLLNQLLGHDRAIVSETEGTTRDTIEETASIRGIPIIFVDTAGIRESKDEIEAEGIRRSRKAVDQSEIVLHIIDASAPLHEMDLGFLEEFKSKKRLILLNKLDLPQQISKEEMEVHDTVISVSARAGSGLEELKDALSAIIWEGQVQSENLEIAISARHQTALNRTREGIERSEQALAIGESLELVAMDLQIAVEAIGEIVGKTSTEDLLDKIFSQFCIGK